MRKFRTLSGVFVLGAAVLLACPVRADEKKLSKQDIPQKVMQSVNGRLPGVEVTSAEKETENGNVVYDLELKHQGRKYEMDVKEDGTIMEIEKEIKDPPAAITRAVKAKYPDASIKEVMEVNKVTGKEEKPQNYEVTISSGGKNKEVIVSLDGKSVKEEAEEEKPQK